MPQIKPYITLLLALFFVLGCKSKQAAIPTAASKKQIVYFNSKAEAQSYFKNSANVNYAEPKYGMTALIIAAHKGDYELAKYLISKGADVNKATTDELLSPLNRAANNGHLNLVKLLLKHKADINQQDKLGSTALMRASYSGHSSVIQELIAHDALIDVRSNRGESALYLAVVKEQIAVVKLLLAHGVNTERPTVFNDTPLSKAKELSNTSILKLLQNKE